MAEEFKLQDPGEGIHEAEILDVRVSEGDSVEEGDIILEIETDKAAVEIPAPFSGVVESIRVGSGDTVEVGDVLMTYSRQGNGGAASAEKKEAEGGDEERRGAAERDEAEERRAAEEKGEAGEKADRKKKREAKKDERRREEEPKEAKDGEKKRKAKKEDVGPAGKKARRAETEEGGAGEEKGKRRETERSEGEPVPASPATRRRARELEVDLHDVSGSGPGGRVLTEDLERAAGEELARTEEPERKAASRREGREKPQRPGREAPPLPDFSQWGKIERVPLRSIRRATARRMAVAWSQIPHVTHQDVADITELEEFRRDMKSEVGERGGDLSLTILVAKAAAAVLREFPRFNASLDDEQDEIILKRHYHLGIAVDTEQGLLVPVLRDVDRKTIMELAVELSELTEQARTRKISREALQGGTFTITNPGPLGGTSFTPIIQHPQVAILGMARARLEPVLEGDLENLRTVARLRLPLMLGFDHRVNDGADAARFLTRLVEVLRDPDSLLLNV